MLLCAKLQETPTILAARIRVKGAELERKMQEESFTRQDGLILTIIEREVDFLKGGVVPASSIFP